MTLALVSPGSNIAPERPLPAAVRALTRLGALAALLAHTLCGIATRTPSRRWRKSPPSPTVAALAGVLISL